MTDTHLTLKGIVRYDGAPFAGWQVQPGQPTVQGALEHALSVMAGEPIAVAGAGRTDAGVHALGQVFSCRWPRTKSWERLPRAVSGVLGPAIRLDRIEVAAPEFHARKDARSKRYGYTLALTRNADPFAERYSWHVPADLDVECLRRLLPMIQGRRDFAGFCCAGSSVKDTTRTLHAVTLERGGIIGPCDSEELWRIIFHGNGFLYKMVRNLTGTLVDIARGHLEESVLNERLAAAGPYRGFTAPAHGLVLLAVEYP